ncbi:hypothetical protein [Flavobacterium piscisymbiosum]|uniref:Uncharacterized protein n=1 Tax=Flavobacterium piscisymbiosum TaxID=2893753 RepID=A0ABS8M8H8_9FLAO|nr:hypothetical protein [Flavobacterium sp. F-30]MCC9061813.1 hypothetical protein [Flavobacterium sp. F-30]
MKNIKILFTSLLFILIAVSCDNDGGSSVIDVIEGATPDLRKEPTTDQGINIIALQNNEDINLGLNLKVATGQVASMNVVGYFTHSGAVTKAVLQSNVSSFPAKLSYKTADLVKAFPTFKSFGLNDKLIISADLTLTNGTVIKTFNDDGTPNYGADIANSTLWKVSQTYTALCPLDDASLFNGNYEITADDWSDYKAGTIIPVVYNGTDGTYTFRILETKNPALVNPSTAYLLVTINPATNTVTVKSNIDFDYGGGDTTPVTGTGTVGSCTGDINLKLNFPGFNQSGFNFNLVKSN